MLIVTPIGPFYVSFALTFYYGCDLEVGISNFRDVFIQINFNTGLDVQFKFAFFLALVKFGIFLDGTLLNIGIETGFKGKNMIPSQLLDVIAPV